MPGGHNLPTRFNSILRDALKGRSVITGSNPVVPAGNTATLSPCWQGTRTPHLARPALVARRPAELEREDTHVNDWSVYALVDPRDDQVRYVGKSVNVAVRVKAHLNDRGSTRKARWLQLLLREGLDPEVIVLETGSGDWERAEVKWIAHFRSTGCDLTNATTGGEGLHDPSPETRARIREIQLAAWADPEERARRSAVYSLPEWRAAVSAGLRGKSKTAEHVAALPQNRKGYQWSEEVRAARREIMVRIGSLGRSGPRSEAQLQHTRKLIEGNRGRPGWARGRVLTEEERRARSTAQLGRPKSDEHKEKIRQAALRRWAKIRDERTP